MRKFIFLFLVVTLCGGCSIVLHEREKNEDDPADQGSETKLSLRGPKAVVSHNF
ncbi:MAG: hypothetical protein GF408_01925 [Candidatus Omnitrophica bacterium]|nr:hypothetical protein [Candidatus Omnitrophota bacterium]